MVLALLLAAASPARADQVTLAALGDSLTQGYGLDQADGFVPQLQDWLRAQGADVTVINAGVSGDTTAGGLARVDWTLGPEVQGLIVALGANDILRGLDPGQARANLDAILSAADAKGVPVLLIGMWTPGNYGPEYQAAFNAIYPELAQAHGALLVPDFLAPLRADWQASLANLMQPDALHPNPAGVKLMVEGVGPKVLELIAEIEKK